MGRNASADEHRGGPLSGPYEMSSTSIDFRQPAAGDAEVAYLGSSTAAWAVLKASRPTSRLEDSTQVQSGGLSAKAKAKAWDDERRLQFRDELRAAMQSQD